MAKYIFFFAIAALAFAQQGQAKLLNPSLPAEIRNATLDQIDAMLAEINKDVLKAQQIASNTVRDAANLVDNSLQSFKAQFTDVTAKVMKAMKNQKDFMVQQCSQAIGAFSKSYNDLVAQTKQCVDNHVQGAISNMNEITHTVDLVLVRLGKIREEASHCTDGSHGIIDFSKAVICSELSIAKATAAVAAKVPHVTLVMTKLSAYVSTLGPKVSYCTSLQTVKVLYSDFFTNLSKVNECIL